MALETAETPQGDVLMVSRALPEWGLALLALAAGGALLLTGDQRLGAYLVWIPGVTAAAVAQGWGALFLALGAGRVVALRLCCGIEAACAVCPLLQGCRVRPWRCRVAAVATLGWALLAAVMAGGDAFALPAALAGTLAFGELALFSLLSSHAPWIRFSR